LKQAFYIQLILSLSFGVLGTINLLNPTGYLMHQQV